MNWLWIAIVGKFGLGLVLSVGCVAAWWLIPPVPWLTDRLRTGLLALGVVIGGFTLGYGKGGYDTYAAYKVKIQKEADNAIAKGNSAKADALREFDASPDELPNDGFRRP
jgi:hypothetical protein